MVSWTLCFFGRTLLKLGDYLRAAEVFTEGLRLSSEVGFRWMTFWCLVGLANVSAAHVDYDRGARLCGAAEVLREAIGFRFSPREEADHNRLLASTHSGLGEGAFAAAWAEGRAMTLEQAIEYALNAPHPDAAPG